MKTLGFEKRQIDRFKRLWPAHGLPDNLAVLLATFAANGDLVDLEARDSDGDWIATEEMDGPALAALVSDIQAKGWNARPEEIEQYV